MRLPSLLLALCALGTLAGRLWGAGIFPGMPVLEVEHSGSLLLTCWSACPEPGASGAPELSASSEQPEEDSAWSSHLLCSLNCSGAWKTILATLTAPHAPEQQPLLWLQEGDGRCLVPAPERNLSVTLDCGNGTVPGAEPAACRSPGSRPELPCGLRGAAILLLYRLSEPQMEMDTDQPAGDPVVLAAGDTLGVLCTVSAEPPARTRLRLLGAAGKGFPLTPWERLQRPLELVAREEWDGAALVCDAEAAAGAPRRSSAPVLLNVTYAPRLDEGGCPAEQHWTEGREAALRCTARGNPAPHVECRRDGGVFPVEEPRAAAREHGGIYRCRASNGLGEAERDVRVHVEASAFPVLPVTLLLVAAVAAVATAGAAYGLRYRRKRIGHYSLRRPRAGRAPGPPAPNGAAAAPKGSAPLPP